MTLQLQTCDRDRVAADPSESALPEPVTQPSKAVNVELARAASVLVVGDFARMAGITDAALRDLAPRARLLRTVLKSEALHLLSTTPVDLILAVCGPSLATAELTHAMNSLPLPIPILVIDPSPGLARDRGPREGVEHLHVPVNASELRERIAALLARRAQIVRIEGVSLAGFVQLVEMERRTCTLFVAMAERRGTLGFSGGRLVDAQYGERDGEPAALEILGKPVTAFAFQGVLTARPATIRRSLTELLLEAACLGDESARTVASSTAAESRTERVSTCWTAAPCHSSLWSGPQGVRARVGLRPKMPQQAAGMRMEPPPSPPVAIGTMRAATAAAEPPEEPPVMRVSSHGLWASPWAAVST